MANPSSSPKADAAANQLPPSGLPKRFYKVASVGPHEAEFAVLLDGRGARTPAKKPLAVADEGIALAMAVEWEAQADTIDPARMPLTRLINTAIDRVSLEMAAVREDVVRHAGTDLICYRAEGPDALVEAENTAWSSLLDWARGELGARLLLVEGIIHAPQDEEALAAVRKAVAPFDALGLAALHAATTLTGSAVIALALARGRLTAEAAWHAAHVDEDFQMSQWGRDEVALARRAARYEELKAAALVLAARKRR